MSRKKNKNSLSTFVNTILTIFGENPFKPMNYKQIAKIMSVRDAAGKDVIYQILVTLHKEGKLIAPQNMETSRLVQVEKKTGKARYIRLVNDYLGGLEVSGVNFRYSMKDNYVYFRFNDALKLKEQLEEVLNTNTSMDNSIRERITYLKNSLHEDSNDVIVLCKFKKVNH